MNENIDRNERLNVAELIHWGYETSGDWDESCRLYAEIDGVDISTFPDRMIRQAFNTFKAEFETEVIAAMDEDLPTPEEARRIPNRMRIIDGEQVYWRGPGTYIFDAEWSGGTWWQAGVQIQIDRAIEEGRPVKEFKGE